MITAEQVITQTQKWITDVVIGCNFCPFAAREVKRNRVRYQVETSQQLDQCLQAFLEECNRLDEDEDIETTLLIFPENFGVFEDYLDFVELAEQVLEREGYEGVYQVASFHPLYCFADAPMEDAANYTNRSVYPMLHLLREASMDDALDQYAGDPDEIPQRNIRFSREKGEQYMRQLREACI